MQRNCYYQLKVGDGDYASTLDKAQAKYVEYDGNVFIVGEDALKYSGISGNMKDYHRPMKDGVLNPEEEDGAIILGEIIKKATDPKYELLFDSETSVPETPNNIMNVEIKPKEKQKKEEKKPSKPKPGKGLLVEDAGTI